MDYTILGLFVIIISQQAYTMYERRRYIKIIDRLTDKLLARDYQDYRIGESMKEIDKEKVTTRPRTDVDEALIEQENLEALEAKTKKLGEQLDKSVYSPVGGA